VNQQRIRIIQQCQLLGFTWFLLLKREVPLFLSLNIGCYFEQREVIITFVIIPLILTI
jgi:hypothetical protein